MKREVERSLETNGGKIEFQLQMSKISTNGEEGVLVRLRNISARKQAEARILYLSYYDPLTGLYNRSFFEVELKRLDTERQLPLTVIMGDLNGLRLVNDTFGHEAGDKLLCKLAQAIRKALRREDIVARWGGDQFVILLHRTSSEMANQLCQRIRQTCREQGPDPIELSISLGTATKEVVELDVQSILRVAEDRMYASKQQESQSVSGGIISSLERSLWESKSETEEHAERLKRISQQLGRVLQLPGYQIDELALLALLHDIGKVVIPPQILAKPERLSPEEWETVKRHPQNGYRIATSSTEILLIAEAILTHHEHWDGSGYPRGLKGGGNSDFVPHPGSRGRL
jgi:diguanylate cyclase (GGDEF)-like protein